MNNDVIICHCCLDVLKDRPDGSRYCERCGPHLRPGEQVCPQCRTMLKDGVFLCKLCEALADEALLKHHLGSAFADHQAEKERRKKERLNNRWDSINRKIRSNKAFMSQRRRGVE